MLNDYSNRERRNLLLSLNGLLYPIKSMRLFVYIIPLTGYFIARSLLHRSWSTGWNLK